MSKDESKGGTNYGFLFGIILVLSSSFYVFFIVPTYPTIDSSLPKNTIQKKIKDNLVSNADEFLMENSGDKRKIEKFRKAFTMCGVKLENCKTKECLISEYEDFMDDWVSSSTKTYTRYYYLHNLGFIGQMLNEAYKEFY